MVFITFEEIVYFVAKSRMCAYGTRVMIYTVGSNVEHNRLK